MIQCTLSLTILHECTYIQLCSILVNEQITRNPLLSENTIQSLIYATDAFYPEVPDIIRGPYRALKRLPYDAYICYEPVVTLIFVPGIWLLFIMNNAGPSFWNRCAKHKHVFPFFYHLASLRGHRSIKIIRLNWASLTFVMNMLNSYPKFVITQVGNY